MPSSPYTRRIPKKFTKTITFTGAASLGAVGTVPISTVTGAVIITYGAVRCTTLIGSAAGATLALGCTGNTAALIATTTAVDIDANEFWQDATPELRVSPAITNINVCGDVFLTVAVDAVTSGTLEFTFYWLPLSDDGQMA